MLQSLLIVSLLCGCAHVEIKRVQKSSDEGARFYRAEPYLFRGVTEEGCEAKLVYLPDLDEEWLIRARPGLGSVKGSATLSDGWQLTSFGYDTDSRIPETIDAVVGAAKLALPRAKPAEPSDCPTELKKLDWRGGAWQLP
jgi:hypothetical protein